MSQFPIENHAGLDPQRFSGLEGVLSKQSSMKHAFDWLLGMTPQIAPVDYIALDEYSHEILFPYPENSWLVYSCT